MVKSGKFKFGLAVGQINPRGSDLLSFCNAASMHLNASEVIFDVFN